MRGLGRQQLTTEFATGHEASWLADPTNARSFAGEGVAYFPSQGNDPMTTAPFSNIQLICETMTNDSLGDEVKRLSIVTNGQRNTNGIVNVAPWLKRELKKSTMDGTPPDVWDLWGWQTCNEFGFYQTCDIGSKCMYTQGLDLLVDEMSFCETDYKITKNTVQENINQTNLFYGSDQPVGSRVMWVNGEVDPWHGLSVNTALPGMPVLYVKGASHHAWTHPLSDCSQQTVLDARKTIRNQVTEWLKEE